MNICSLIARDKVRNGTNSIYKIALDLMEDISFDEFKSIIHFNKKNKKSLLSGIFHDQFSKYLISYINPVFLRVLY